MKDLGIAFDHIFANNFLRNDDREVIGYDSNNPLSKPVGKVMVLKYLELSEGVIAVGAGYTDVEIKIHEQAERFYLYAELINRKQLYKFADVVDYTFNDLLEKFSNDRQRLL